MSNTKKGFIFAICVVSYVLLNIAVGNPLFKGIHVDFGYIPIMILCVASSYIGLYPAVLCGAFGYTVYSVFFAKEGFSLGLFVSICIVSYCVAWCCKESSNNVFVVSLAITTSLFVGAVINTAIECSIFYLPVFYELLDNITSCFIELFIMTASYAVGVVLLAVVADDDLPIPMK